MTTGPDRRFHSNAVIAEKLEEIESAIDELRRLLEHRPRSEGEREDLFEAASKIRGVRLLYERQLEDFDEKNRTIEPASDPPADRLSRSLSPSLLGIRNNLFEASHGAVKDWPSFRWHRSRSGEVTADLPTSSQAFCVSTWGTAASERGEAVREVIARSLGGDEAVVDAFGAHVGTHRGFQLEHVLDANVLGEGGLGNPTNLDAVWFLPGLVLVVESKLTEPFGVCGQARDGYCTGRFGPGSDLKTGTDARCRLEIADGRRAPRRYWEVFEQLARAAGVPSHGEPCPLARGGYQVARVIAAAAELGRVAGCDWRVVFAYPAMLLRDTKEMITEITRRLTDENRRRVLLLDYSSLAPDLLAASDETAQGLGSHLWQRLAACRHHDAWEVLSRVPAAKPLKKLGKFYIPQYGPSMERGMTLQDGRYHSKCAYVAGYIEPSTTRLSFVVADASGVRLRREPRDPGLINELAQVVDDLTAHGLTVVEEPHLVGDAGTIKVHGPYPDVLDRVCEAVEARGYRALLEEERAVI